MESFKTGGIKILVATDVASRGIHVEDISHVINYDLPQYSENYVHRIGRTARAGKTGRAISLACENYVLHLEPLEEMLGYKIPVVWHEDDWLVEDKSGPVFSRGRSRGSRIGRRGETKAPPKKRSPRRPKTGAVRGSIFGLIPEKKAEPFAKEEQSKKKRHSRKRKPRPHEESHTESKPDKD